jgi:hypothetical protein
MLSEVNMYKGAEKLKSQGRSEVHGYKLSMKGKTNQILFVYKN